MPGEPLKAQAQQLVLNLCEYFELEKQNGGPLMPFTCVQGRVAAALKISRKTIYAIRRKKENNPILSTPGKCKPCRKAKTTDLPEFSKMAVRNTLYNMYKEKRHVTVKTLNTKLKTKEFVFMGELSLGILLKQIGFKFTKDDNRRALMERTNICSHFLREYMKNQTSPHPRQVVFLDETWIYSKGNKTMSWQDNNINSVRKPEGYDGKRFIVFHAGSSKGFIHDADLLFCSKSMSMDYHGEMNSNIFTKWITDQLISNLEEPSLIILDNAPYHSVLLEKQPSTSSRKDEITTWLKANNVSFCENLTKPELLQLAKMNRKEKIYVIDEVIREHGHEVLRLPPYHCDFNAIELIWAHCKQYYNKYIGRDEKVISMWQEALQQCNGKVWDNCVRHTDKLIKNWFIREEHIVNIEVEPLIIANVGESSE